MTRVNSAEICSFLSTSNNFLFYSFSLPTKESSITWCCLIKPGHNVTHVLVTKNNQCRVFAVDGHPKTSMVVSRFFFSSFSSSFFLSFLPVMSRQLVHIATVSLSARREEKKMDRRVDSSVWVDKKEKRMNLVIHHYFSYSD